MKLLIQPKLVISAIAGLGLWAFSERINPGYGGFGDWIIWLGFSVFTLSVTRMHAHGESKRNIPKSRKWVRVLYRGAILVFLSFLVYKSHFEVSAWKTLLSTLLLALNQAFLFGVVFDIWYNEYRDNDWNYHGTESWYDRKVSNKPGLFLAMEIMFYLITSILVSKHVFI